MIGLFGAGQNANVDLFRRRASSRRATRHFQQFGFGTDKNNSRFLANPGKCSIFKKESKNRMDRIDAFGFRHLHAALDLNSDLTLPPGSNGLNFTISPCLLRDDEGLSEAPGPE